MAYIPKDNGFNKAVEYGFRHYRPRERKLYDQGTTTCPKCKRSISNRCNHKC
jgi:hypothetical protein